MRRRQQVGRANDAAALNRAFFKAMQIHRRSLACMRPFNRLIMHLQGSHPRNDALRQNFNHLLVRNAPGNQRSRRHRAKAFDRKHAINRQAQDAVRAAFRYLLGQRA